MYAMFSNLSVKYIDCNSTMKYILGNSNTKFIAGHYSNKNILFVISFNKNILLEFVL